MNAILRSIAVTTILWGFLSAPARAEEAGIRLDNFWSDGPVSVFLYERPHGGLDPTGFIARHDLNPGQVAEIASAGHDTVWADVRVMHADGQRWVLSSASCGYRRAFAVRAGQTVDISYKRSQGYAASSTGLSCHVLEGGTLNP